jgi:3alpha(or 20beta)-hydroxysteroid dehydrogenase
MGERSCAGAEERDEERERFDRKRAMARLTGKIALISGAARGMGASHARAIVAHGGQVVVSDILDDKGAEVVTELGDAAVYTHLDVTQASDWESAVDLAVSTFGGLNVLVNNAGIVNFGALGAYTKREWDHVIAVNLTGPFLGISAARNALVASAPASIINISSIGGMSGGASAQAHGYVASKFGLRGLTKTVALELGSDRVRANSIHPGVVDTPMAAGQNLDDHTGVLGHAEPHQISNLVVYLASDESDFSTGAEFIADGGQLAGTGPILLTT